MEFSERNHYVPVWFQRRFLEGSHDKYYYLDLNPEIKQIDSKRNFTRKALHYWGPKQCFKQDNLYTTFFGNLKSDEIEKRLFGDLDRKGSAAIGYFSSDFNLKEGVHDAFNDLIRYMDAQRFRTPKSLDWIKLFNITNDHNAALFAMQSIMEFHVTMWMEGIWEFVSCKNTNTKFILTDTPITFYNSKAFPGSPKFKYPNDVGLTKVGTRTIFPIDKETCLIITHLQYVRNPWQNSLRERINVRAWKTTISSFLDIQFGRELEEIDVLRINYILKQRASKYIAAAQKEWLYPEKKLNSYLWSKLDKDWFLFPNPNHMMFSGGIVVGYKDGSSFAMDEYGRTPGDPNYQDEKLKQRETRTFYKAREEWDRKRKGKPVSKILKFR